MMASPDLATDELVSLILGGQTELFEEIIRRYQGDVHQVVSRLLFEPAATEDIVQQVFINAYFALGRFRLGSDFRPWVRAIARNAVREQLRKQSRYDRRLRAYFESLQVRLAEDAGAQRHEETLIELLERCIERLSERQATAIRLRYCEGKTNEEIAAVLGSTSGAVRNMLCRVRVNLRECAQREINLP